MKEKILRNLSLFASFPDEEIRNLSSNLQTKEIAEGTFVFCEVAREIQSSISPRIQPQNEDFVFGHKFMPVSAVGGDFFDFIPLDENSVGIAIGDVTDHGVPDALIMALAVTILRAESHRTKSSYETLTSVNRQLLEVTTPECLSQ